MTSAYKVVILSKPNQILEIPLLSIGYQLTVSLVPCGSKLALQINIHFLPFQYHIFSNRNRDSTELMLWKGGFALNKALNGDILMEVW